MIYLLSDTFVDGAVNLPVIETVFFTPLFDFSGYDAFIFTSKNGVNAIDRLYPGWKKYPSFTIGKATSKLVEQLGGRVSFCGENSYGQSLSDEIKTKFSSLKFLYIRPKVVAFDIAKELTIKGVSIDDIVVYETRCTKTKLSKPEPNSSIIFSSPSTVECFFSHFEWDESYRAVAIGNTTARAIPTGINYLVCPEQTLVAAVKMAKEQCKEDKPI